MVVIESQTETSIWDLLRESLQGELDQYRRELKEINLMLEQSRMEVTKLTQRNISATAHLQHVQAQFDSLPRGDIRMAYDSALDAQQRLFVIRGQLEKMQSDQTRLQHFVGILEQVLFTLDGYTPGNSPARSQAGVAGTVEMMIQSQEAERQRLSRQMHDGPAQALSNFILQTEIAMRLFDRDPVKAREELASLKAAATSAFQKVRDFIFDLRPMMLDDLGLVPTVKRYVESSQNQSGTEIRLLISGMERRLEPYLEVMLFRAIQELVSNALHHSQATQITVQIDLGGESVKVSVDDNGQGFDPSILAESDHVGLKVIRDRVEMLAGVFDVDSLVGRGTRISFQVPAAEPE